jgi:hypothetical protein
MKSEMTLIRALVPSGASVAWALTTLSHGVISRDGRRRTRGFIAWS